MSTGSLNLRSIASGALTMSSVNVLRLAVQMLSLPVMARLLSPEDYGLAAMAMPLVLFVMMIADGGMGSSLIRTKKIDGHEWHTCFWLSCALGAVFTGVIALFAPLCAILLEQPRLTPIIIFLSSIVLAQTISLIPGAALQKEGKFGTIAATEIAALLLSLLTAVLCAMNGFGVWALIWQQIVFYAVRVTSIVTFSSYRPRMIFNLKDAWEHIIFGWHILGTNLVWFVSRSADSLVIGKVLGAAPVGIYSMATQFARLPFMLVTGPLQYVLYPHVTGLRDNKEKMAEMFILLTQLLALVILPSVLMIAVASKPIFHLLLSAKWEAAAPVFLLLAPAAAIQPVTALVGTFLMALGRTDIQMRLAAKSAILWFVVLIASAPFGIQAVAGAYSALSLLFSLYSLRQTLPLIGATYGEYARAFLWPALLTCGAIILYLITDFYITSYYIADIGVAALLTLVVIGLSALLQRKKLMEVLTMSLKKQIEEPV